MNDKVEDKRTEILEFARDLIRIPTQNPPGENYDKIVLRIKKELDELGLRTKVHRKNGKPNLVAVWNTGASTTFHTNGHYDVVPATGGWTAEPFDPIVKGDKLYGRGAQDMKSALAVMVYSVATAKEFGPGPKVNVELSFTCDEETGGEDGLGFLVESKKIDPDIALTLDGPNNNINHAHKGVLALEVTVKGRSYHAAWPQKGVNAFTGACKLALRLDQISRKLSKDKSGEGTPSLVLGGRSGGGSKFNTVPGQFTFTLDRRVIPGESIANAKNEIGKVIGDFSRQNPRYKIETKILLEAEPAGIDKDAKICRLLSKHIQRVKGKEPGYSLFPGFLDMRFLVNQAGIPCVNYGLKGGNIHGDDEYVHISSMMETVRIIANLIADKDLGK